MSSIKAMEFAQRRQELIQKIGSNGVAIVTAAPECIRNADGHYPYRQDSDFYYLTGFNEPEAVMVLLPGRPQGEFVLFNRKRDPAQETWTGLRAGQAGAISNYGANEAFPIDNFLEKLSELLIGREKIYYTMGQREKLDQQIITTINQLQNKVRMGVVTPTDFINLNQILHELRLIKSAEEIALMRKAAQISAQAHITAMRSCKAGLYEYQLEAKLLSEFYNAGSRFPAYSSIVGSGANSCILHYGDNNAKLKDGDLVLIDAGCEYQNYASDITRTFPVNGCFSAEQRAIYEIVLAAQLAAIAQVKPGSTLEKIHETTVQVLVEGLVKLKILTGNVKELIEKKSYLLFYMHRTSHWLGLATHDAGKYKLNGEWRKLMPCMVLTIEPGL
jgi:Xaa-Pro aminopeptidase